MGRFVLSYLRSNGVMPAGFLDNQTERQGGLVDGLPVRGLNSPEVSKADWIVVAVKNQASQVEEQCRMAGCVRTVRGWQMIHAWAGRTRTAPYVSDREEFLARWEEYDSVIPLLADDASRRVLKHAILYQITCQDEDLPPFDPDEYFRPAFPPGKVYRDFVDCGAFDGDTLRTLLERMGPCFEAYHAFEPDPETFRRLESHLFSLPADVARRVKAHACAVGSQSGFLRFHANGDLGSFVEAGGDLEIPVVRLDEVLGDFKPTFVKMDVEGAEPDALAGAEDLIRQHRPLLAICVYHRPEHYASLPLWIHGLGLGYRLEMHHHTRYITGTVCYAIPPGL